MRGVISESPARVRLEAVMARITAEDLLDLGRWASIQFRDQSTADAAMDRYHRYLARQQRADTPPPAEDTDGRPPGKAA
ncbi:MAG: hypothetical protein GEU80_10860 [Dehalococcoidia bacterium]|nr:hypothetical protein [Dehalococcoidia bacterium]